MIINRPCSSCGISLKKGVKLVTAVEIILGCMNVVIWSLLIHYEHVNANSNILRPNEDKMDTKAVKEIPSAGSFSPNGFYLSMLFLSSLQILLGFILILGLVGNKVQMFNIWLVLSPFTILTNGILPKLYELIIVYAYSEEIKSEAHETALENFRKLPYVCNIKTQVYPFPLFGSKKHRRTMNQKYSAAFQNNSFLVNNAPSVFSVHRSTAQCEEKRGMLTEC